MTHAVFWHHWFQNQPKNECLKVILASNRYQKASGLLQKHQDLTAYHLEHICTGDQFAEFFATKQNEATNNVAIQLILHIKSNSILFSVVLQN